VNRSDTITELATALAKAQGTMKAAEMNAVNPFLKNHYADLGSIIEAARPAMTANGLSFVQAPAITDAGITLETMILHASGEWLASSMTLPVDDKKGLSSAQASGSVITYLRRYALAAMLGIYADKDDDGNDASNGHDKLPELRKTSSVQVIDARPAPTCPKCHGPMWDNRGTPDKPKLNPKGPDYKCKNKECDGAIWPPKDTPAERQEVAGRPAGNGHDEPPPVDEFDDIPGAAEAPITDALRKAMFAQAKKVYGDNSNEFREWVHAQYHVASSNDLTVGQANEIINKLRKQSQPA